MRVYFLDDLGSCPLDFGHRILGEQLALHGVGQHVEQHRPLRRYTVAAALLPSSRVAKVPSISRAAITSVRSYSGRECRMIQSTTSRSSCVNSSPRVVGGSSADVSARRRSVASGLPPASRTNTVPAVASASTVLADSQSQRTDWPAGSVPLAARGLTAVSHGPDPAGVVAATAVRCGAGLRIPKMTTRGGKSSVPARGYGMFSRESEARPHSCAHELRNVGEPIPSGRRWLSVSVRVRVRLAVRVGRVPRWWWLTGPG